MVSGRYWSLMEVEQESAGRVLNHFPEPAFCCWCFPFVVFLSSRKIKSLIHRTTAGGNREALTEGVWRKINWLTIIHYELIDYWFHGACFKTHWSHCPRFMARGSWLMAHNQEKSGLGPPTHVPAAPLTWLWARSHAPWALSQSLGPWAMSLERCAMNN